MVNKNFVPDYLILNQRFNEFQDFVFANSNIPFDSFSHTWIDNEENYKSRVRTEARNRLKLSEWVENKIGTGIIIDKVISAIEIWEPNLENNLLNWGAKYGDKAKNHRSLINSKSEYSTLKEYEQILYNFFLSKVPDKDSFNMIQKHAGKMYAFIAYLFFIKDERKYLPIATKTFDLAFKDLGLDFWTSYNCSWENYSLYNKSIGYIKSFLEEKNIGEVRLIDAHSFLWILYHTKYKKQQFNINTSQEQRNIKATEIDYKSPDEVTNKGYIPKKNSNTEIDFIELNRRNTEIGKKAEDIVFEYEINILESYKCKKLIDKVQIVSDNHSLGYDILSYDKNGNEKQIEVKALKDDDGVYAFYLTENEVNASIILNNYFIYLVKGIQSPNPEIFIIRHPNFRDKSKFHIENINYKLHFEKI